MWLNPNIDTCVCFFLFSHPHPILPHCLLPVARRRWHPAWRCGGRPWAKCAVLPSWPCASSSYRSPSPGGGPSRKWWVADQKKTTIRIFPTSLIKRMIALLFCSTVRCAGGALMRTCSCCVMAVKKAATLTATNPRSPVSQRGTGTAWPAYPRYQSLK